MCRITRQHGNVLVFAVVVVVCATTVGYRITAQSRQTLSASFVRQVLATSAEAPFDLRFFTTAVKTDSRGEIITGETSDPVKNIVGAEPAGERAGLQRFTKIMFGANYFNGTPSPSTRIDPNDPQVTSGNQHWPNVPQPFRSWPNQLAVTPTGDKLYVALPGREGYPDWRVAVVDTLTRTLRGWIDLRPPGSTRGTRPTGIAVAPPSANSARPYVVVLNEYANFASVIDTGPTDAVLGEFETGFYGQDLVFNATGTRLYTTDRFDDQVRAFRIDPGPRFTQIATIPSGHSDLERANPRDLALSADGKTLYVANTLGHTVAAIDVEGDANVLLPQLIVGGLTTDVKIAGRWGIVSGHGTNNVLNGPDTGDGLPKFDRLRNNGQPLGYTPVMTDATRATTFDDLGSEINVFDTSTNLFVQRYVDHERDKSMLANPGVITELNDYRLDQEIIRGSGPEQIFVSGNFLFVSQMHSDKVEVFSINPDAQQPPEPAQAGPPVLTWVGTEFTGGITPQGIAVSLDGKMVFVSNMQTEDISFLDVDAEGKLTRRGTLTVGVTGDTPDPTKPGNHGQNLFATHEEIGLRWFFTQSYSDDGQKSCGHCHWQSRHDGSQWNVGANAVGGVKVCPQNKDISDNWPEWFEGLNNDMTAYASACNGELNVAERRTALFPQTDLFERLRARDAFVLRETEANSRAIGRPELSGKAFKVGFYDMAFLQILWSQNETRLMPNPLTQFPTTAQATAVTRGRELFTKEVNQGGAGCASCHHNGNRITNGELDDTFQDYNIHEPGVVADHTVDNDGPFTRLANNYFFIPFGLPQDEGGRQNISSRNTKHLRAFWDSVPNWLHHGDAHTIREILLGPDSPLLAPGERGFNFRTVRTDHSRRVSRDCLGQDCPLLPTEVPITFADSSDTGSCTKLAGDGKGPLCVSLDSPHIVVSGPNAAYPEGRLQIDRLGTSNVAPLIVAGQINAALAANNIAVLKDTHGKTSQLSRADIDALSAYLRSLQK